MILCNICSLRERLPYGYKCAECHCDYQKKYNKANPESIRESFKRRKKAIRDYIALSRQHPCKDCGLSYPWYVMDFDHVRGKKRFNLSVAASLMLSITVIDKEIAKCDLVCANCHRVRTFERLLACSAIGSTSLSESENTGSSPV